VPFPRTEKRARTRTQARKRRRGRWAARATEPGCGAEPHVKKVYCFGFPMER